MASKSPYELVCLLRAYKELIRTPGMDEKEVRAVANEFIASLPPEMACTYKHTLRNVRAAIEQAASKPVEESNDRKTAKGNEDHNNQKRS